MTRLALIALASLTLVAAAPPEVSAPSQETDAPSFALAGIDVGDDGWSVAYVSSDGWPLVVQGRDPFSLADVLAAGPQTTGDCLGQAGPVCRAAEGVCWVRIIYHSNGDTSCSIRCKWPGEACPSIPNGIADAAWFAEFATFN